MTRSITTAIIASLCGYILGISRPAKAQLDPNFDPNVFIDHYYKWENGELVPNVVTPICNDILMRSPGEDPTDGCYDFIDDEGEYSDMRIITGQYGPRRTSGAGPTNEFHRGVDFTTTGATGMDLDNAPGATNAAGIQPAWSRPVFAAHEGRVHQILYTYDDDNSTVPDGFRVVIEHTDDRFNTFFTVYKHLWAVAGGPGIHENEANTSASTEHCGVANEMPLEVNATVHTGQFIGCTGLSSGGYHHLHFEVRKSKNVNRNAVHPLRIYESSGYFDIVNYSEDHQAGSVEIQVESIANNLTSLLRVLPDQYSGKIGSGPITQPLESVTNGYHTLPSHINFEQMNHEYTHDSTDWATTACPYHDEHTGSYSPDAHFRDGDFNGIEISEPVADNDQPYRRVFVIKNFSLWGSCHMLQLGYPTDTSEELYSCN